MREKVVIQSNKIALLENDIRVALERRKVANTIVNRNTSRERDALNEPNKK